MSADKLRIIFMGTPQFAVESLKILVENGHQIVAVITSVDKPAGRGKKLRQSAVKEYALSQDLHVLQPPNLKRPSFVESLRELKADVQVVVAFRMLPEIVWDMPPQGTINLHASLLPQYRGAAPINWAIINGETETGVCTFKLKHEIDTGSLIFKETVPIHPSENAGQLHDKLMLVGSKLILKTIEAVERNEFDLIEQTALDDLKKAPKIFKEDCEINWDQESPIIYNFVRGLCPYPTAWTRFEDKVCKIFMTEMSEQIPWEFSGRTPHDKPGTKYTDNKTYLHIATKDGVISILELQLEGKKRMRIQDFLRGNKL